MTDPLKALCTDKPLTRFGVYLVLIGAVSSPYWLYRLAFSPSGMGPESIFLAWIGAIVFWLLSSAVIGRVGGGVFDLDIGLPDNANLMLRCCYFWVVGYPLALMVSPYVLTVYAIKCIQKLASYRF